MERAIDFDLVPSCLLVNMHTTDDGGFICLDA